MQVEVVVPQSPVAKSHSRSSRHAPVDTVHPATQAPASHTDNGGAQSELRMQLPLARQWPVSASQVVLAVQFGPPEAQPGWQSPSRQTTAAESPQS